MTTTAPVVVWFRRDLRLTDNPALAAAAGRGPVIPLFILDDVTDERPLGAAARWWLDKSLRELAADLARAGAPLILRHGPSAECLADVVGETGARAVFWNRLYHPRTIARDRCIKADLDDRGVEVQSFNAGLLTEPWAVKTGAGDPYRVFTPYWRAARGLAEQTPPGPTIGRLESFTPPPRSDSLEDWRLHPRNPDWSGGFADWRPGEAGAMARLEGFLASAAAGYADDRNRPDRTTTSRLSPHLSFGEIGPRQVWAISQSWSLAHDIGERHIEAFLRELGWREFNHHLLFHFPAMVEEPFNVRFARFPWREDDVGLRAWRRGATGFPIIDAGMRELWATGWMHNRVRMAAASFLVKDLLVDWRLGEAWFWDTLVDADLANNVAGWQWVAGSGADAAPYFRIFNPVLQGEKFDPNGTYVRRWVSELAGLPDGYIHQPWRADRAVLAAAGVRLGVTYPNAIVDHGHARDRALAAYEGLS